MRHLWFEHALLPAGWAQQVRISTAAGAIAAVAVGVSPGAADERHWAAIPGLGNVHSHGFQRGMAGLAERQGPNSVHSGDNFWSWREVMYRFLDRLTPEDIAAITAQTYVEMLETGTTRVGEFHYLHHAPDGQPYAHPAETAAAVIEAAQTADIGLTLLPVFYAHGDFGGAPATPGQRRFLSTPDGFARLVEASRRHLPGDARLGIAPHSLRAVTPAELVAILPLVPEGPIHIHAAEQTLEVDACVAWSGARPVQWLLANAEVDARWCLVHATHLDAAETAGLAASGAVAGLCPVTEANLGDGIFPTEAFLAAGGRIGIGSDSNVLIDAAGELRGLEYAQRLCHRRRAVLAQPAQPSVGQHLFAAALAGGAQALGGNAGIAVGNPADLVAFAPNHPAFAGAACETLLDRWIFAARGGAIDTVWRAGRRVVSEGRHHAAEAVAVRYRTTLARLLA